MTDRNTSHVHTHTVGHDHAHTPARYGPAFIVGVLLNSAFVVAELVYGRLAGSLSLVADAGHNASDVLGLLLAWAAYLLSKRGPTTRHTYGFRRSSILASLANAALLLVALGAIGWEAVQRLLALIGSTPPAAVAGGTVIVVAVIGIVVNGVTAWLFASGRRGDLNIRGAFLHMLADALVSAGVAMAGVALLYTGWQWLDPLLSLVIAVIILRGTWGLLRASLDLALDAVPEGIDLEEVRGYLAARPGVSSVHDLHVWGMSTTEAALSAHLVMPGGIDDAALLSLRQGLHQRFGVEHSTLQVEHGAVQGLNRV
ncbi:cation diffusion facilitator family transporter [Deinococcus sp.]|uniref:cation diffusion facilitator family transporter n=1 Tax=Deinococcus sp. TaxID=47478 RepID=UPI003C7A68BE